MVTKKFPAHLWIRVHIYNGIQHNSPKWCKEVEHNPHKERPACGELQSNRQMARLKKSKKSFFIYTLEQF